MPKKPVDMGAQLALLEQRAARDREAMLADVLGFAETDLLCYRAEVPELHERQRALFDPILNTLHDTFGITCRITRHVMPVEQPPEMLETMQGLFAEASDRELAALYAMTPMLGSALLALGVWKGLVKLEEALAATHLDETFQAEQWAEDPAEKAAWETKMEDIKNCALFLSSVPGIL